MTTALQPSVCSARRWPAPRIFRTCLSNCMPAETCSGAGGLSTGQILVYPVSCSSDNPGAAAEIIDCLLFQKWKWLQLLPQLAAVSAVRPPAVTADEANATINLIRDSTVYKTVLQLILDGGDLATWKRLNPTVVAMSPQIDEVANRIRQLFAKAKACVDWCARVWTLVDQMLDATNINAQWLLGGLTPTGPADWTSRTRSADPTMFPSFNASLVNLPRPGSRIGWPVLNYGRAGSGLSIGDLDKVLPPFWPADYSMDKANPSAAATDWPLVLRGLLGPMPARSTGGMSARPNPEWERALGRYAKAYMMFVGTAASTGTIKIGTTDELVYFAPVDTIMQVWQALARDLVTLPYENFVLGGVQRWATNMSLWAQAGLINRDPATFGSIAQAAITTQSRIATGLAISTAGGTATAVATAVNPVAGAVVGVIVAALGALTDLLFQLGVAAVGGWHCPQPLVRRSAGGACDFTQILGPGGVERVAAQVENVTAHAQATAQAALDAQAQQAADARARALKPWLIGGAAALAVGAGYYLLKGK